MENVVLESQRKAQIPSSAHSHPTGKTRMGPPAVINRGCHTGMVSFCKHIGRGMFYTRPRRLLGVSRANSRGTLLFVQGCLAWFVMEGTQYSQWLLLLRRSQRKLTANLKQSRAPVTMVPHCSPSSHSELKVCLTLQKPTPSIHRLMPTIKLNRHQVQQ